MSGTMHTVRQEVQNMHPAVENLHCRKNPEKTAKIAVKFLQCVQIFCQKGLPLISQTVSLDIKNCTKFLVSCSLPL